MKNDERLGRRDAGRMKQEERGIDPHLRGVYTFTCIFKIKDLSYNTNNLAIFVRTRQAFESGKHS